MNSAPHLKSKVALVTGALTGIGRAIAHDLLEAGARVVVTGLDAERGNAVIGEFNAGANAIFCRVDVRKNDEVKAAFAEADRLFGGLDILINNAGVNAGGHIVTVSEELWDTCMDTNMKGVFLGSCEAVPRMRSRGGGVIVNIASNAGLMARAADPVYCASKAGLVMLTRAMALSHAPDRIRVNAVCPGPVTDTQLMNDYIAAAEYSDSMGSTLMKAAPLSSAFGRMIIPSEVASLVLYLCGDTAQMITGAVIAIDSGKSSGVPR